VELGNDPTSANLDFIVQNAPRGMTYLPIMPDLYEELWMAQMTTSHTIQASILQVIQELGIKRP
jgi:hypothetical protein